MTPSNLLPSVPRLGTLLVVLLGAMSPSAHAAGRNHDAQPVTTHSAPTAVHDRAPGPVGR